MRSRGGEIGRRNKWKNERKKKGRERRRIRSWYLLIDIYRHIFFLDFLSSVITDEFHILSIKFSDEHFTS